MTKLLLVGDNAELTLAMQGVLSLEGYDVESVNSGIAALEAVETCCPDVIITNVEMPDVPVASLVRAARNRPDKINIPLILTSIRLIMGQHEELLDEHTLFLPKPFTAQQLLAVVSNAQNMANLAATSG